MFKLKMIKKPILFKLKCDFTFPPIVLANMQEKEAIPTKEQQEIVPDKNYDGLSKVTVNPIPDEYIIPSGEINISQNGTYDVTDKASANVNIHEKVLGTKTIISNGIYKATDDNLDGYSKVEVATSGVDINEYFETTYSGTSPNNWLKNNFVKKVPDIVIDDSVTSLRNFCSGFLYAPKIICNSNITNMGYMYSNNTSPNIDVSGLNTSNVENMDFMFNSSSLTSLNLSNFNTSKVKSIKNMFSYCSSLTSLDLSNFDTSNVTNTTGFTSVFEGCSGLTNLNVSNWNVSNVKVMQRTFTNCSSLINLDLSGWKTSSLTNTTQIFSSCRKLTRLDIRNFDFSNVTSYSNMFSNVPADCLIIVKDDTAKTWITSKFTSLTNVKTVAELGE